MEIKNELMRSLNGEKVINDHDMKERRKELIGILEENAYGIFPPSFPNTVFEVEGEPYIEYAGKAEVSRLKIKADTGNGIFEFPATLVRNLKKEKSPLFVHVNFAPTIYSHYTPGEEIIDNGFSFIYIYYQDVTSDDNAFGNGLAAFYDRNRDNASGKISMWAWAASRAVDCALMMDFVDTDNIAVVGHSRLGKTALWCGANDERVKFVISNDSGCMGAAYEAEKHENAETHEIISRVFPFWFCPKFNRDAAEKKAKDFDQHYLIAACAPRFVLVASAVDDLWADPKSEFTSCVLASPAWKSYGLTGFAPEGDVEGAPEKTYGLGEIAYRRRYGRHFLSRGDWNFYMDFINAHK